MLTPRAGRTANEMAEEAGAALPAETAALREAALMFDDICYGGRPGTPEGYALVSELDTRIGAALPRPGAILASAGAGAAAPPAGRRSRDGHVPGRAEMTRPAPVLSGPGPDLPGDAAPPMPAAAGPPGPGSAGPPGRPTARPPVPLAGTAGRAGAGPAGWHRDRPADTVRAHRRLPRSRQSRIAGQPGARRPPGPSRAAGEPGRQRARGPRGGPGGGPRPGPPRPAWPGPGADHHQPLPARAGAS